MRKLSFSIGFLGMGLLAPWNGRAQYDSGSTGDYNTVARQIDQQFNDAIQSKKDELPQAQGSLRDCALEDEARKNDQAAQKAVNDGNRAAQQANNALGPNAPGGGLPGNIGDIADAIVGNGANAVKAANANMNNIRNQLGTLNQAAQDANRVAQAAAQNGVGLTQSESTQLNSIVDDITQRTKRTREDVLKNDFSPIPNANSLVTVSNVGITPNYQAVQSACRNAYFRRQTMAISGAVISPYRSSTTGVSPVFYGGDETSQCVNGLVSNLNSYSDQYDRAINNKSNGTSLSNALMKAGLNTLVGSLGSKLAAKPAQQHADDLAKAQDQSNDTALRACQQAAQDQINAIQNAIKELEDSRSRALANAKLQAAAAGRRNSGQQLTSNGNTGAAGGSMALNDPTQLTPAAQGPQPASVGASNNSPTAPSAPAAGGGNAAGAGTDWTYGTGRPFPGYGPNGTLEQPSFESSGGGGGGGAFGFGGDFGFGQDPFSDPNYQGQVAGEEYETPQGFGDGGLLPLMARARGLVANHAEELVRSIDLKKMASSPIQ